MLEMILGVYHVMYNGASTLAIRTLEDLQTRCGYELFPESILLTNAIYNAIKVGEGRWGQACVTGCS